MNLSKNLTLREATRSGFAQRNGLSNKPDSRQIDVMRHLAENLFQPVRDHFGKPIFVSSFYRSKPVNLGIGGSLSSDHMILSNTAAIDMDGDVFGSPSNHEIFHFIRNNLKYYKMIWEFGTIFNPAWVHVSYSMDDQKNDLRLTLIAYKRGRKTLYKQYS